jgi:hypothetical protein
MDISPYQVQHVLRVYAKRLKSQGLDTMKRLSASTTARDEVEFSYDGKKKQLAAQVLSQVVGQLIIRRQEQEVVEAAEDNSHTIPPDEGRR